MASINEKTPPVLLSDWRPPVEGPLDKMWRIGSTHLLEIVAMILAGLLMPIGLVRDLNSRKIRVEDGEQSPIPVLLIHGYLQNSAAWLFHRRALRKAGFDQLFTLNLSQPWASIEGDLAEEVKDKINEIKEITGTSQINIVTHSMGGVVAATVNELHGDALPVEISKVIMLVPPLSGSDVLRSLRIGECRNEILPESELLAKLRKKIASNNTTHYRSLISTLDRLVSTESATIDPHRSHVIDDLGHVSVLYSPRVSEYIIQQLDGRTH